jgi:hypothetical protein
VRRAHKVDCNGGPESSIVAFAGDWRPVLLSLSGILVTAVTWGGGAAFGQSLAAILSTSATTSARGVVVTTSW